MKYMIAIASLLIITGCAHPPAYPRYVEGPPGLKLPDAAMHPKLKGGMSAAEVRSMLPPGTFVDDAVDLRLPVADLATHEVIGYHDIQWLNGYINKIYFHLGKEFYRSEGIWLIYEHEKEDNNSPELIDAGAPKVR